jgi:hypothetical protein
LPWLAKNFKSKNTHMPFVVSLLAVALLGCHGKIKYSFENATTVPIDITFTTTASASPPESAWERDRRLHYDALGVGEIDNGETFSKKGVQPGGIMSFVYPEPGLDMVLIARDSNTRVLLYKKAFTRRELEALNWRVQITDMRLASAQPDSWQTGLFSLAFETSR